MRHPPNQKWEEDKHWELRHCSWWRIDQSQGILVTKHIHSVSTYIKSSVNRKQESEEPSGCGFRLWASSESIHAAFHARSSASIDSDRHPGTCKSSGKSRTLRPFIHQNFSLAEIKRVHEGEHDNKRCEDRNKHPDLATEVRPASSQWQHQADITWHVQSWVLNISSRTQTATLTTISELFPWEPEELQDSTRIPKENNSVWHVQGPTPVPSWADSLPQKVLI